MSNNQPHIAISINDDNTTSRDEQGAAPRNSRALSPNQRNTSARNTSRSPVRRNRLDSNSTGTRRGQDSAPLLDTEEFNPEQPPIAGPEIDDDGVDDDIPYTTDARPGVDDGFFPEQPEERPQPPIQRPSPQPSPRNRNNGQGGVGNRTDLDDPGFRTPTNNGTIPRRGTIPPNFPYAPEFGPAGTFETAADIPRIIPDINVYQHKKTLAQGMMDLALLSANANQLRYVTESYQRHPYYYFCIIFISASLILQIAVGIGLIWNSRYNIKNEDDICKADKINNYTVMGIFLVTVVNVFISAFGVAPVTIVPT